MSTKQRQVTLQVTLTECELPLSGTRAWVAQVIEQSTVVIGENRKSEPIVYLSHPVGFGDKDPTSAQGKRSRTYQIMAHYTDHPCRNSRSGKSLYVDPYPFWDAGYDGQPTLFGVTLTNAGLKLAADFGRKCRTLLRLRLRKDNANKGGALRVKILAE